MIKIRSEYRARKSLNKAAKARINTTKVFKKPFGIFKTTETYLKSKLRLNMLKYNNKDRRKQTKTYNF